MERWAYRLKIRGHVVRMMWAPGPSPLPSRSAAGASRAAAVASLPSCARQRAALVQLASTTMTPIATPCLIPARWAVNTKTAQLSKFKVFERPGCFAFYVVVTVSSAAAQLPQPARPGWAAARAAVHCTAAARGAAAAAGALLLQPARLGTARPHRQPAPSLLAAWRPALAARSAALAPRGLTPSPPSAPACLQNISELVTEEELYRAFSRCAEGRLAGLPACL
jgi:hypothetical protein